MRLALRDHSVVVDFVLHESGVLPITDRRFTFASLRRAYVKAQCDREATKRIERSAR